MKEKEPIENFFDQIADIIRLTEGGKQLKGEFPPDILEKLQELEKQVEILKKVHESSLSDAGITDAQIQELLTTLDGVSERNLRFLEKIKKLKTSVDTIKRKYGVAATIAKHNEKMTKKGVVNRKKKFRSMGGNKDWKPM